MNVKIDRKLFIRTLSEVAPFAPQKAVIAILKYAKITTKGNRMKIEANDGHTSIVKYIELISCDADGSFLIDISDFVKFVSKIKDELIDIEVNGTSISITHKGGVGDFESVDAVEYPSLKVPDADQLETTINSKFLLEAVQKGKGFVCTDTLRPQMCAIYAYLKEGKFGYCATDTCKLIHGSFDATGDNDVDWYIIPNAFSAITNMCKENDSVMIYKTETHASYRAGNTILQTAQPKGAFPNFKRVIPQKHTIECSVDKAAFQESLSRTSLFCNVTQCVKMGLSRLEITLTVDNMEQMKKSKEMVIHNGCDGELVIGVNNQHLMTCIQAVGSKDVIMHLEDESRPISFKSSDNDDVQIICMPMQITT